MKPIPTFAKVQKNYYHLWKNCKTNPHFYKRSRKNIIILERSVRVQLLSSCILEELWEQSTTKSSPPTYCAQSCYCYCYRRTFAFNHSIFWSTYLTIELRLVLHHCFKLFKNHLCWSLKANLPYLPVWLMSQSGEILKPQIKVQTPHLAFVNSGVLIFSAIFIQHMLFIEKCQTEEKKKSWKVNKPWLA